MEVNDIKTAQALGEIFYTALKSLGKADQEVVLSSMLNDRKLRQLLENVFDRLVIAEERGKVSRPLREYMAQRERRE